VSPPIGRRAEFNKVEKHSTLADINYDYATRLSPATKFNSAILSAVHSS
jgi:hypothetical protein